MEAESFFARWSKRKADTASDTEQAVPAEPAQPEEVLPPPTIEDVAALTPESDFTRFVARGVDEDIRRSAMKKLFADPHFNVMDGLDIYIDDYSKFEPIPPEMLAMLNHAKGLLDPLSQFEQPLMRLLEDVAPPEAPVDEPAQTEPDISAASAEHTAAQPAEDAPPEPPTKPDDDNPIQSM
ncbi:MAG TPA: DUF3306 domain-containing protein [Noviherbaspirillum sp.]|uniref:DUF3306 domain-containing protein n=1 Tax=Noviherbaspirillum sp. TaxID=1926288 RepID=UPI002DDD24D9|nr:DUF3306 domain-containing protein [Noviherbaspirillum sp.]HEV2611481.1 DUF3306 domain-containing protein [Noviherbaspirillum sp.]